MPSIKPTPATRTSLLLATTAATWLVVASQVQGQDQLPGEDVEDQGVVANVISRLLTTPTTRISIGAIEGVLSTSAVIHDITISDPDGVWLTLGRAELDWSLTALLRRRLQVSELTLDDLVITRRPLPTDRPEEVAEGPVFPELPVAVVVENFTLGRLVLEEPVLGTAAELSATGSAQLVSPEEGLQLAFAGRRLDAEGSLDIEVSYLPQTNFLTLNLVHDEPEGGIVARLLDLPGLPPVQLQLSGDAPLENFVADLNFQAGPTIGAQGVATVNREVDAYRLDLDVGAQVAGLLPEAVAPLFEGTTQLAGVAGFLDDGSVELDRLRLASPSVEVEITGSMDAERMLNVALVGATVPGADGVTRLGEAQVGSLAMNLTAEGMITAPRVAGRIDAEDLVVPQGAVAALQAQIDVTPQAVTPDPAGVLPDTADSFIFSVDADATGIATTNPALAAALGDRLGLVARGSTEIGGGTTVDEALVETPTMSATYAGFIGERTTDGLLEARIPSLVPFSDLVGLSFEGAAALTARITGDPLVEDLRADLEGALSEFATGQDAIDGLLGPQVAVSGAVRTMRDGFAFEGLRLDGANLDVSTNGMATQENADLEINGSIPRLEELHERLDAGQAQIVGRLTGSLERPNAFATATLEGVQAMNRAIPRFVVGVEAQDVLGAIDASLSLDGEVGGNPAAGGFRLRAVEEGWALDPLDITIGSVSLDGDLLVGPMFLTQGSLNLRAGDLDDLSPLLLTDLAGAFDLAANFSVRDGDQDAVLQANAPELSVAEILLRDFRLDATGQDVLSQPRIDGVAEAGTITFAGQTFTEVRVSAEGTAEATNFSLSAVGDGAVFETDGRLMPPPPGDPLPRLDLQDIRIRPVDP
jgi:translocation and assembly module TamB